MYGQSPWRLRPPEEAAVAIRTLQGERLVASTRSGLQVWHVVQDAFETTNLASTKFMPGVGRLLGGGDRLVTDYGDGQKVIRCPPDGIHVNTTPVDALVGQTGPTELILPEVEFDVLNRWLGLESGVIERALFPLFDEVFEDSMIRTIAERMCTAGAAGGPMAEMFLEQSMMTIALATLEHSRQRGGTLSPSDWADDERALDGGRALDPRVARADDYIRDNLHRTISVAELADVAAMSAATLLRGFKAQIGTSPHRHVVALRHERACDLLRRSRMSVQEIAWACGFGSAEHFSRSFKDRFGVTPTDYARRTRFDEGAAVDARRTSEQVQVRSFDDGV